MLPQGRDHVAARAPLQDAGLLAHDLERAADPARGQDLGHALRGVVARREEVVLGVEPQDHHHLGLGGAESGRPGEEQQEQQPEPPARPHSRTEGAKLHFGRSETVSPSTRADAMRSSHACSREAWRAFTVAV